MDFFRKSKSKFSEGGSYFSGEVNPVGEVMVSAGDVRNEGLVISVGVVVCVGEVVCSGAVVGDGEVA